jgi:hypothetical protein
VTEETRLKCDGGDDEPAPEAAGTSSHGDDDPGDHDKDDWGRHGDDDDGDHDHDGDWGDHKGGCDDDECPDDALKVGANVKEAELKVTSEGRVWEELELR